MSFTYPKPHLHYKQLTFCQEVRLGLIHLNPCYICTYGNKHQSVTRHFRIVNLCFAVLRIVGSLSGMIVNSVFAGFKYHYYNQKVREEQKETYAGRDQSERSETLYTAYNLFVWLTMLYMLAVLHYVILLVAAIRKSRKICKIWAYLVIPFQLIVIVHFVYFWQDYTKEFREQQFLPWLLQLIFQLIELWFVLVYYEELKHGEEVLLGEIENKKIYTEIDNIFDKILNHRLAMLDEYERSWGPRSSYDYATQFIREHRYR